jgi:hypothetical protein
VRLSYRYDTLVTRIDVTLIYLCAILGGRLGEDAR